MIFISVLRVNKVKKPQTAIFVLLLTIFSINLGIANDRFQDRNATYVQHLKNETLEGPRDVIRGNKINQDIQTVIKSPFQNINKPSVEFTDKSSFSICKMDSNTESRWADVRFKYRKRININASKVINDLSNFPVLIDFYDNDLKNVGQTNGNDIKFTDILGNKLEHEIERFDQDHNSTHSRLITWVKTNLSSQDDTQLLIYYGNDTIKNQENPEGVWDNSYVAVWHLSEISGIRYDSTSNKFDGSPQDFDGDEAIDGKIDGADEFDGVSEYIETYSLPSDLGLGRKNPKTISTWVYTKNFNGEGIFEFGKAGASKAYCALGALSTTNEWRGDWGGSKHSDFSYNSLNSWVYFSVVYDGDKNVKIYADNQVVVNENNLKLNILDDLTFKFGKWHDTSFRGIIDEIRVSTVTRSDYWIKTEYNNQHDPASFVSVGFQETDDNPPVVNSFGVEDLGDDKLTFHANVTDDLSFPQNVTLTINGSEYEMEQDSGGIWIYQYSAIKWSDYLVYQISNATDAFGNYLTTASTIKDVICKTDNIPPRVTDAYYMLDDEDEPTEITFYAEVEENGSGIDEVILYYQFEAIDGNISEAGLGSAFSQEMKSQWDQVSMELYEKSGILDVYSVTVPFPENKTNWKVLYQVSAIDVNGNGDIEAFQIDLVHVEREIIISYPSDTELTPFPDMQFIILIMISMVIGTIVITIVSKRLFQKPELIGLDKNLVMKNIDKVSKVELLSALNTHTFGIVVSFFDEQSGPSPLFVTPKPLEDSNMILRLSFRAFSNCEFSSDFEDVNQAIFNFTSAQQTFIKVISYSFALNRPHARAGQENITLSILMQPTVYPIFNQFTEMLSDRIRKIHKLLDKKPEEKFKIIHELIDMRELISRVILSYSKIYGNTQDIL